ncbi:hypothetical protein EYF80_064381 [Liparis tanakae]|uniref:Uncharacterized protein n=1 Tax=Liparis tanakae TaxID=230148 RepID=A0A4Z2E9K1_9TELE|nr:hypothetical protein EYF80_064381 [Liparis tanakae]
MPILSDPRQNWTEPTEPTEPHSSKNLSCSEKNHNAEHELSEN